MQTGNFRFLMEEKMKFCVFFLSLSLFLSLPIPPIEMMMLCLKVFLFVIKNIIETKTKLSCKLPVFFFFFNKITILFTVMKNRISFSAKKSYATK